MNSEHKKGKSHEETICNPHTSLNTYLADLTGSATLLRQFNFS